MIYEIIYEIIMTDKHIISSIGNYISNTYELRNTMLYTKQCNILCDMLLAFLYDYLDNHVLKITYGCATDYIIRFHIIL